MAPLGRGAADSLAGEEIIFHNEKKKVKEVEGMPPHNKKLVAPLFNLVGNVFQYFFPRRVIDELVRSMNPTARFLALGKSSLHFSGHHSSFFLLWRALCLKQVQSLSPAVPPQSSLQLADDSVEDINEHHVGGWTEMLQTSNPPLPNTPLSAYMDKYALDKHIVALNSLKIKEVVGYKLRKPHFGHETMKETVDKWKSEGSWPILE